MRGGHSHWRDVSAKQKCLSVAQKDIAVADIGFSCAQGFNLPALQGKSRFELFFDKVFVTARLLSAMVAEPGLCAFFFVISVVNHR